MLRDLLLGLLGFPGDILVVDEHTMRVRHDFDLLTIGERDQVNRLAPMGWYYLKLRDFVRDRTIKWENDHIGYDAGDSAAPNQLYLTATSKGVEQLLLDYVDDVTYLDLLIEKEGPMPLSQIASHLKKYTYTLPAIFNICVEIRNKNIRGCQILDYLAQYRSGYLHVKEVTSVMLRHVRGIFVRQCLGWMLYADLDDVGKEFFIHMRTEFDTNKWRQGGGDENSDHLHAYFEHLTGKTKTDNMEKKFDRMFGNAMKQAAHGAWVISNAGADGGSKGSGASSRRSGGVDTEENAPFDWASTFTLKLDMIPETHISSRLASKILLTGKAVKMLQAINGVDSLDEAGKVIRNRSAADSATTGARRSSLATFQQANGVYKYLAGVKDRDLKKTTTNEVDVTFDIEDDVSMEREKGTGTEGVESYREELIRRFIASSGYSEQEVSRFVAGFYTILKKEDLHVEVLEQLVDEIHSSVSSKLWQSLKHVYGFTSFLSVIRNTYLLGKGELYQLVLDGITAQTFFSVQSVHQSNVILDGRVLRSAAGVLGLDEDELCDLFRLRVNVYKLRVTAASAHQQAVASRRSFRNGDDLCGIMLAGAAAITVPSSSSAATDTSDYPAFGSHSNGSGGGDGSELKDLVRQIREGFRSSYRSPGTGTSTGTGTKEEGGSTVADEEVKARLASIQADAGARFSLCSSRGESKEKNAFGELFRAKVLGKPRDKTAGVTLNQINPMSQPPQYTRGALWLSEPKNLVRGFACSATFGLEWSRALNALTSVHPWLIAALHRTHGEAGISTSSSTTAGNINKNAGFPSELDWSISSVSSPTATHAPVPRPSSNAELLSRSVTLGCLCSCFHSARTGLHSVGTTALGLDIPYSVSVGLTVHATLALGRGVHYYLRVLVAVNRETFQPSSSSNNTNINYGGNVSPKTERGLGVHVITDSLVGIDGTADGFFSRCVSSMSDLALHVEYTREVATAAAAGPGTDGGASGASVASSLASLTTLRTSKVGSVATATTAGGGRAPGSIYYILRASVVEAGAGAPASPDKAPRGSASPLTAGSLYRTSPEKAAAPAPPSSWDVQVKLDLGHYLRMRGGTATAGFTASGLHLPSSSASSSSSSSSFPSSSLSPSFGVFLSEVTFEERGKGGARASACPYTISRFPETHARLDQELAQLRSWMNIQLRVRFPAVFHVIFDDEALSAYQRLFSLIMKIRLVAHSLEKLWKTRSRLASDRGFCQLRHSMHFFISNLLYYLQVDVVDSEYALLLQEVDSAVEFQQVLRAHRNFLASVLKASLVDNTTVQDAIDRVIQACLRFVAVCRLLHQQEGIERDGGLGEGEEFALFRRAVSPTKVSTSTLLPVVVPTEEVESVRKDFFSQIVYLFTIMSKVENRGFMFRLDFNEYLSSLAQGVHY